MSDVIMGYSCFLILNSGYWMLDTDFLSPGIESRAGLNQADTDSLSKNLRTYTLSDHPPLNPLPSREGKQVK